MDYKVIKGFNGVYPPDYVGIPGIEQYDRIVSMDYSDMSNADVFKDFRESDYISFVEYMNDYYYEEEEECQE